MLRLTLIMALALTTACGRIPDRLPIAKPGPEREDLDGHAYRPIEFDTTPTEPRTKPTPAPPSVPVTRDPSVQHRYPGPLPEGHSGPNRPQVVPERVNIGILIGKWHNQCRGLARTVLGVELKETSAKRIVDVSKPVKIDNNDYTHVAKRSNCRADEPCDVNASTRHYSGITALSLVGVSVRGFVRIKAGIERLGQWKYFAGHTEGAIIPIAAVVAGERLAADLGEGFALEIRRLESREPYLVCPGEYEAPGQIAGALGYDPFWYLGRQLQR